MGRVPPPKGGQNGNVGGAAKAAKTAKQRRKQKVVLESTSQEKNKLRSVITFRADPPPGYTFIPAGNPELTNALKEVARRGEHKIFSVSTTPHPTRHELSREVHRVGFHFPTEVVSQVCALYGIRLTSGGKIIDETKDNNQLFMKVYQKGQLVLDEKVQDQVTINTDAKQIIKDLFPNIPDKDLFQIIKTAFQLGDHKVGTADEIPLVRRAQLSVVAHVRHIYTEYDKLLRRVPYNEARHRVEKDTLQKLVEWRGDNKETEGQRTAVDDIFREVIVISDEEESDAEDENDDQFGHDELRIEELPSNAYAPIIRRPLSPLEVVPVDEAPAGYRFLPQIVHRNRPTAEEIALRDRNRYAIWDQARQDYRMRISQRAPVLEKVHIPEPELMPPRFAQPDQMYASRDIIRPRVVQQPIEYEVQSLRGPSPPAYVRGENGVLYEKVVTQPNERDVRSTHQVRRFPSPIEQRSHHQTQQPITELHPYKPVRRTPSFGASDDFVLPSIEVPSGHLQSPVSRQTHKNGSRRNSDVQNANGTSYEGFWSTREPLQAHVPALSERSHKRRRIEDHFRSTGIEQGYERFDPVQEVSIPSRSTAQLVANDGGRRVIDLDDRYSIPTARHVFLPPQSVHSPKPRSNNAVRDDLDLQAPLHSSGSSTFREPYVVESRNSLNYSLREPNKPVEPAVNGVRRVILADKSPRRFVDSHVMYDHSPRHTIYEDRRFVELDSRYEQLPRSPIEQDMLHGMQGQEHPRRILEVIPADNGITPTYQSSSKREYIPISASGNPSFHASHLYRTSSQTNHLPDRLDNGQRILVPESDIERRYDEQMPTTYTRR